MRHACLCRVEFHGAHQHSRASVQHSAGDRLAPYTATPTHRWMRSWREHPIHPRTRVCRPAPAQRHLAAPGLKRELVTDQRREMRTPQDHVAPRQHRIESTLAQLSGD